jgi:hypothetical protein
MYTYIQYTYSQKGGGGGGRVEQKRRGEGQQREYRSQSWAENTHMTECTQEIGSLQYINSDKHLPQSPFTGQFFELATICVDFYEYYLSTVRTVPSLVRVYTELEFLNIL